MSTNPDTCVDETVVRNGLSFPFGLQRVHAEPVMVTPEVMWLQVPLSASSMGFINTWALRDGDGWAVVDVGMDTPAGAQRWAELVLPDGPLGGAPTRIIGTHMHADHVGYAGELYRRHGCELWMTRGEYLQAKQMIEDYARPTLPEHLRFFRQAGWSDEMLAGYAAFGKSMAPLPGQYRRMREGDVLAVGDQCWQVITTCGHSPEHACLYNAAQQLLIGGDQVLADVSSNVSVMPVEPWANPMKDWLNSLQKMATLFDEDVLVLPAHGAPFRGLPERARQLATKRLRALDRLRDHLRENGPQRALDVYPALFSPGSFANPFLHTLATGEALAYLNHLLGDGQARVQADAQGVNWYELV
ncbi:hypothetical protein CCO03_11365 [Comamonas serinivorans]|uniref:Metallo-beta-lactamase domain-containing protein n=1 Tax=Comamonas serinivorans TaxID=1082851 RepID=A0A1Y0EP29_9BURK|nr:MBL fold metallo-hydrolase [Comamonas serinivorans]ARU05200.1 hypothetical protein CCO03_11365 [Comamonas serinivorans]